MKVLVYDDLNPGKLGEKIDKVSKFLAAGDFPAADAKKMSNGYYRAKLDDTNRLLFEIGRYKGETYIFILEVIHNHTYEKSKFLNGAKLDENKLVPLYAEADIPESEMRAVSYINPRKNSFHLLDKILSFDEMQEEILFLPAPGIIIGSAGSGKTALTLEKLKMLKGNVLYTTLSSYLVENAGHLYSSFGYENDLQEVSFLSFYEYLSTISMPPGREADFINFERWISRYTQSHKIKDAYRIFEEFKGVITGSMIDKAWLSLDEYLALGIKQSIFSIAERGQVYDLFTKYLAWIARGEYFDSNIVSFELLHQVKPIYDYVIVDEVQDLTNVQLMLILKSLRHPANFVLCGDANQIVHPNFFSWAQVKTLFYKQDLKANIIRVLATNYRNTPEVTALANQLLLIKNARFGSIDKESNYLVIPNSNQTGKVEYLENNNKTNIELNSKTNLSTKFAVLVLRNEDKAAARKFYGTPLLFSIQEAKGLEYENIILYNTISTYDSEFRELTRGVTKDDLLPENLTFARARDKADKSLEEYKFYVNSLYVGITRAVKNLFMIEANKNHALLGLLGLIDFKQESSLTNQTSSKDEWQQEARRLEMQGKQEQADAIREQILQLKPVTWQVTTRKDFPELLAQALNPEVYNKKAKDRFYFYIVLYNFRKYGVPLANLKYRLARDWVTTGDAEINLGLINLFFLDNLKGLEPHLMKYGMDFRNEVNLTPLMCSVMMNSKKIMHYLLENEAKVDLEDNLGRNAFQLVLRQKYVYPGNDPGILNEFYHQLKPESIKVKINNQLVKIGNHQAEFVMLNMMLVTMSMHLANGCNRLGQPHNIEPHSIFPGFQTADFMEFFDHIADHIVPEYRTRQAYISSVLSKNELNREGSGNKKLFVRLKKGLYALHPLMEVLVAGNWVNVYDNIDLDFVIENYEEHLVYYPKLLRLFREQLSQNPDVVLDSVTLHSNF
ncbi:UvrD-helicase domain-containing protein [Pedobacter sp. L105]|uniref:UvrD-helicase domain-containing protein n=1 Tax=Pedobacter sp. L105 TaxID=1641871 RepID=UPI00131DE843|nr:UvrD-helicase domain-containing protein [Pedobacter sp. L105]